MLGFGGHRPIIHFSCATVLLHDCRARNCIANAYGVDKISYGLSAYACRSCPNNMVTSTNRTAFPNSAAWFANSTDGLGGFTSPMACVNQAGDE